MDARIDTLLRDAAAAPGVVPLAGGLPAAELFPRAAFVRAFGDALESGDAALQYGWPEGSGGLREWIAGTLSRRGCDVGPGDVIVTNGAQQAIAIAMQALLRPGDAIEVDAATYPVALDLIEAQGARAMLPGHVSRPVTCRYVMPGIDNPRGAELSRERAAFLCASPTPIIADEAYADLHFVGPPRPLLAEARDRVWHIGTFSKTLCPGLRIGYLVPPRDRRGEALASKHAADLQSSSLGQAVLERFLRRDDTEQRLTVARTFYAHRADVLAEALRLHLPAGRFVEPRGGFSIFLELDLDGDDAQLLRLALSHGVSFDPGRIFRHDHASSPLSLRVCFSAVDDAALREGARRLGDAVRDYLRTGASVASSAVVETTRR